MQVKDGYIRERPDGTYEWAEHGGNVYPLSRVHARACRTKSIRPRAAWVGLQANLRERYEQVLAWEAANPEGNAPRAKRVYGLGDAVADLIKALTMGHVQPCAKCNRRVEWLNIQHERMRGLCRRFLGGCNT